MESAFNITELVLLGAIALLAAAIIAFYYLGKSRDEDYEIEMESDTGHPDPVIPEKEEEPIKEKGSDPPALIITVKRNAAATSVSETYSEAPRETAPVRPGYWRCRYCHTLSPDDKDNCVACGHRKR